VGVVVEERVRSEGVEVTEGLWDTEEVAVGERLANGDLVKRGVDDNEPEKDTETVCVRNEVTDE